MERRADLHTAVNFRGRQWTVAVIIILIAIAAAAGAWAFAQTGNDPFWRYLWNFRWQFARGTWMTIQISVLAMILAMALGLVLAICRLYAPPVIARLALAYIEFVRGTPLLVQLYFLYYGLPHLPLGGIRLEAFTAAVFGMGLNYAAYEAEIYRSGLMAVPRAQTEAALALGLSHRQTLRLVVLPQALRLVVPPVTNDFVALFKDTSIVSVVAMTELTKTFINAGISTQRYLGFALVTALIYFAISYPISKLARALERRVHPHHDYDFQPE